jgi:nitroimidazol reductase NimA-like FMN-containing flavoprotein (pyridoxamine 5'-phosphate oxidase superfamily)
LYSLSMESLPESVITFIERAPVCRIATVRPSGEPHVVPVCPVFDGTTIYVDVGDLSATASGVRKSGLVTVLIDKYDDDWSKLRAVLLRCRAREVEGDEKAGAWTRIREKFPQYSSVNWEPRLTLALEAYDWREWGLRDAE